MSRVALSEAIDRGAQLYCESSGAWFDDEIAVVCDELRGRGVKVSLTSRASDSASIMRIGEGHVEVLGWTHGARGSGGGWDVYPKAWVCGDPRLSSRMLREQGDFIRIACVALAQKEVGAVVWQSALATRHPRSAANV